MNNPPLKVLIGLILGLTTVAVFLCGCSKDLFYIPGSIEEEMQKAVDGKFDGMIVYVDQSGKSSFYSAGFNNREEQIPADPHDLFKIGSISKLYIAAACTKLIASGALDLEQKLVDLIPEVVTHIEYAEQITLRMMISHRSGIPEFIYEPGFNGGTTESYLTTAELIYDKAADFKPNKKYAYSNTNYLLLGEILDRTLGYSHHEFIRNEILIPLDLDETYSLYSEVDSNQVMSGYLKGWEPDIKSWDHTRPGGSMIATAEDVGTFLRALIDGSLFSDEEQAIYSSVYEYEHTGWLPGYTSIARYHSDIDTIVIQFVNTSDKEWFWLELERVYSRILKSLEKGL
ncbi:serine hydrolase domain-containing protein [uncultured Marivirga sp.]|uniref:serine hydrolase domain-containing protein n=1 Tax=uncultured Marivirga sp. TaxID=1123707 RepID=UPI0030ECC0BF|tara:strand:- start:584926 stop:585954 length:1029 start_codon:yes stop_codon:yes gene_type:complete